MLIGVSGYAQSGKDSIAGILKPLGFERRAFADKMREALLAIDPIISHEALVPLRLSEILKVMTWDLAKVTYPEVRDLLQRLGTDAGRNILGEDVWVDAAMNDIESTDNIVFSDCRFINEAQAIVDKGGEVWRVSRSGVGPVNDHISEVGLDGWAFDKYLKNLGTLDDLRHAVIHATSGGPLLWGTQHE